MRIQSITSGLLFGAITGLMLWASGLNAVLGAEGSQGAANEAGAKQMTFMKAEGYALNTPFYAVADMARSMAFYQNAMGLTLENLMKDDTGAAFHAEFQADVEGEATTILMIGPEPKEAGAPGVPHGVSPNTGGYAASFNGYLYVADVDAFYAHAVANGAEAVEAPTDQFWGDRTAYIKDPDGYLWMLASKIAAPE